MRKGNYLRYGDQNVILYGFQNLKGIELLSAVTTDDAIILKAYNKGDEIKKNETIIRLHERDGYFLLKSEEVQRLFRMSGMACGTEFMKCNEAWVGSVNIDNVRKEIERVKEKRE